MSDFVTLGKFFTGIKAHQIKNLLENESIPCVIQNETSSQVYNFHTPSDGGVLIKVHKNNLQKALTAISHDNSDVQLNPEDWDILANPAAENPSKDLKKQKYLWLWLAAVISLFLLLKYLG